MSEGVNLVFLLGTLGQDPELRVTGGGKSVLKIRMVTNEVYFDANHQKQESSEWHRVIVWGARAEALGRLLEKGDTIHVQGSLSTRAYEGPGGERRSTTEVRAHRVTLVSNRGGSRQGPQRSDADESGSDDAGGDDRSFFG